jgi:hypothetical protein
MEGVVAVTFTQLHRSRHGAIPEPARARRATTIWLTAATSGTRAADRRTRSGWFIDIAWVLGFLSGVGYTEAPRVDPLQGVDADGVAGWLDNYWGTNPLQTLVAAAKAFVEEPPH